MNNKYLFLIFFTFLGITMFGQGETADEMDPFCAGGESLTFPSASGSGNADPESAAGYGCLGSQPNPAWFYIQIDQGGNLVFDLSQVNTGGTPIDVDFIIWGPFPGPPPISGPENLNPQTEVDCSFSGAAQETINVPGAQAGEIYVILITNYNGSPGEITLTQTNIDDPGAGSTNCDIVCPLDLGEDFVLCANSTSTLTATIEDAETYEWFLDGIEIVGEVGQSLVISEPGTYTVVVDKDGCVEGATDSVTVSPPDPFGLGEPDDLVQCGVGEGPYTFDLTVNTPVIRNGLNQFQFPITYHTNEDDAIEGFEPINPANAYQAEGSQTIFARVENVTSGCVEIVEFLLVLTQAPTASVPPTMEGCDTDGDTFATFDLTEQDGAVIGAQDPTLYEIAYFLNQDDADAYENEIIDPTAFEGTDDQSIFVRISSIGDDTCYDTTSFLLNVTELPNDVVSPTSVAICDDIEGDDVASFDLSQALAEIAASEPGMILDITMHLTEEDANAGVNAQELPESQYNSQSEDENQTIYFRAAEAGATLDGCYVVVPMNLTVNQKPEATANIADYELCDFDNMGDGIEVFNLTTKDAEITGGAPDVVVTYFTSEQDAEDDVNPVADATAYANTTPWEEEVWARLYNTATTCYSTTSFMLVVNPLPRIVSENPDSEDFNDLEPMYACEEVPGQGDFILHDYDNYLKDGAASVEVTYFATQAAAEGGAEADELPEVFVSPNATIYARLVNTNTGCWRTAAVELEVLPAPIAPEIDPLESCDFNLDGVAEFNLQAVIDQIEAALGNVDVTIHETQADAEFGTNPITNLTEYTNIYTDTGIQTVYIRVSSSQTVCYDLDELELIIHEVPEATEPAEYALCDDGPEDTDGESAFDLTTVDAQVLGGLDPLQYSVSYHLSLTEAQDGTGAITNPANYISTTALLYVRVTNNATGCYDTVELQLTVHPLPVANQPEPYTLCDEDNPGDEAEVFDLTSRTEEIITLADGTLQDGINLTFHHSDAEAQSGTNPIENPEAYTNQSTAEAIFVRVTFEATGCYRVVILDIRVEPLPQLVPPTEEELTVCDPDSDGYAQFDLEALVEDMLDNGADIEVTFHITEEDAHAGLNPIPNADDYTNINPFVDHVYVRAENTVTGCYNFEILSLELIVEPTPDITDLEDITLCDEDSNDQNGMTAVNLEQQTEVILEHLGAEPGDGQYTVHYFRTEAEAIANAPRITNTTAFNGQDGQVIFVRVTNNATDCYSISSFTLHINTPLELTQPPVYSVCNEDFDDVTAIFDLTSMDDTILGPFGVGLGYTVNYYEPGAEEPIANPESYENTTSPMTLTVEVITTEGCRSYTTLTIKVLPLPTPNTEPEALVMCDDNNSPDGVEQFNLNDAAADIMDNEPNLVLSYHTTYEDADADTNAIANPESYESGTATIYVRVEANTGNPEDAVCYQIVELELIVNPLPVLGDNGVIPPFAFCEEDTDGIHTFILSEHNGEILPEGADPADYQVRFYYDQAALDAGTALPNQYTNEGSPQDIIVWVRHIESGCVATAPLTLLVEEMATAYAPEPAYLETCDDDGVNDGMHSFDLTQFDAGILGPQDPNQYIVTYYESEADADAQVNAIPDPANYTNTTPDIMTIYAVVTNTQTISGCPALTTVELIVERLAEPVITAEGNTICVDYLTDNVIRTVTLDSGIPGDMGYTFQWYYNGASIAGADPSSPTYEADMAGEYSVQATGPAPLFCVSDVSQSFTVLQSGPASPVGTGFSVSGAFSDTQTITVDVEGYGEYEYRLNDGPWQESNIFTGVAPGEHTITVRDTKTDDPCEDLVIHSVSVIDYPRYFTPNGDGYHDTWNIVGLANQPDAKIYIFDRYGKLVKQIAANGEGWDGTYNGAMLPATDYWFTVTYRELVNGVEVIKEFKAHFAMKR